MYTFFKTRTKIENKLVDLSNIMIVLFLESSFPTIISSKVYYYIYWRVWCVWSMKQKNNKMNIFSKLKPVEIMIKVYILIELKHHHKKQLITFYDYSSSIILRWTSHFTRTAIVGVSIHSPNTAERSWVNNNLIHDKSAE